MQIIARVSVDNRTRALVKGLQRVTDVKLLTSRVEELSYHLLEFPETRGVAVKVSVDHCQNFFFFSSPKLILMSDALCSPQMFFKWKILAVCMLLYNCD